MVTRYFDSEQLLLLHWLLILFFTTKKTTAEEIEEMKIAIMLEVGWNGHRRGTSLGADVPDASSQY